MMRERRRLPNREAKGDACDAIDRRADEAVREERQYPGMGEAGQERLLNARVLVIGAGGLGSPAILYLAAAGVGTLGIADGDAVDLSNLQRQILHGTPDIGRAKTESAREKVERLNPDVRVVTYAGRIGPEDIAGVVAGYDMILDCSDNLATKLLINDACVRLKKPFCYGGALTLHGQVLTYVPGHACLRCAVDVPLHPQAVPTSREVGILGAMAGVVGSIQAGEAIKYLAGAGKLLTDTLLHVDMLGCEFRTTRMKRDKKCPACGDRPTLTGPR
jgi:molybdopterin/thiamine biosynthesis adenylyltransferase